MFPFIVMFLVTSVTTLRERSSGTLERLLTMPMGKLDFLLGYALAFGLLAAVQSALAVAVSVGLLGLDVNGPVWLLGARGRRRRGPRHRAGPARERLRDHRVPGGAVHAGLRAAADPAVRAVRPREAMPGVLEVVSDLLPLSYAVDAMQELVGRADEGEVWRSVGVVAGFALASLALGAATLRRRTP